MVKGHVCWLRNWTDLGCRFSLTRPTNQKGSSVQGCQVVLGAVVKIGSMRQKKCRPKKTCFSIVLETPT